MATARFYEEAKNSDGGFIPGVPLRDLTEDEYTSYPAWLQASIDASPMYRKTKPAAHKPAEKESE